MPQAPLFTLKPFTIVVVDDKGKELERTTWDGKSLAAAVSFTTTLGDELASNSSWIAFWGVQVGMAKEFHDLVQANYRVSRDTFNRDERAKGVKITKEVLDEMWRASPGYAEWYRKIASSEYAWNAATYVYDACCKKSLNLNALSKHQLDEIHAINRAASAGR